MTSKDYTHIPVSAILRNRMHTLLREYSVFTNEILKHKVVVDRFTEEIYTIMKTMKEVTLDYTINTAEKQLLLDAQADEATKLAAKRDKLMEQIKTRREKYRRELDVIKAAIQEEKPELTDEEINSYIDAYTSTLSKNILDK